MALQPGDRLGPFEIVAPIGAGGMGEVYKARDTRLDRIVAIKVSKTEFSERFEREAHAVAALKHSNQHLYIARCWAELRAVNRARILPLSRGPTSDRADLVR
jgi:serine/threonine protein kinase